MHGQSDVTQCQTSKMYCSIGGVQVQGPERRQGRERVGFQIHGPRLNMAMPSPASERIEMDLRMIAGISKFHLSAEQTHRSRNEAD